MTTEENAIIRAKAFHLAKQVLVNATVEDIIKEAEVIYQWLIKS